MPDASQQPPLKGSLRSYKVKNYVDTSQLKIDLAFSPNSLTDAMMTQSSLFAHYGVQYAYASKQTNDLELLLEASEATVYRRERDDAISKGEKPTDANLKQIVSRTPGINQLKKALNEARQVEAIAKVAMESFKQRRDMLVQQGLLSREEMKGDISIREKSIREESYQTTRDQVLAARKGFQDS